MVHKVLGTEHNIESNKSKDVINNIFRFTGFLYQDKTVVDQKEIIRNAKDEDFKEVVLYLSKKFIEFAYAWLQEVEFNEFIDKCFEEDFC